MVNKNRTFFQNILFSLSRKRTFLRLFLAHKKKQTTKFEYEIMKEFLLSSQEFGGSYIYQTHPKINLKGERPTIGRYKIYNLEKYLKKDMEILDVGGNIGFFSLFVSNKVKHVDVVEHNPALMKICEKVKNKLKIENLTTYSQDIKKYQPDKKYDLIFSFAIHKWVGLELNEYIKLLFNLLKKDGIILIESHTLNRRTDGLEEFLKNNEDIKILEKGITDDHHGNLRKFFYIKKI